ncbi:MAG: CapA family protein [Microthrixaceae bacterium]|nr:CapA family protein [Microthrixaceae bacterium]
MPPKLDAEPPSKRRRIAVAALGTAGVLLIAAALVGRAAGVRADEAAMDELAARVDASADREEFSPTPEESAVATDDDPSADGPGASVLGATTLPPDPSSPRAQTGSGEAVTFLFGGDVHLDGPLATTLRDHPERILDGLQPALSVADVSIVNLETAVTERGTAAPKAFNFRAPASIYSVLSDGGVDVIASANNHTLDYGRVGFDDTLAAAAQAAAPVIGIGADDTAAFAPWTRTINGQRIAVINATDVLDAAFTSTWAASPTQGGVASAKDTERLLGAVRNARAEVDTLVVYLHWGAEATTCPTGRQVSLADQLIEAGADIIVGGHQHRVLSGGFRGDAYVGYGLGNLVFKTSSAAGRETGLLRVTITGRRVDGAEWLPGRIGPDFTPDLLFGAEADAAMESWNAKRTCTNLTALPGS